MLLSRETLTDTALRLLIAMLHRSVYAGCMRIPLRVVADLVACGQFLGNAI
jgi:hypothetical protein